MAATLKFIQFGMGPIGEKIARYLLDRENVELEAAIDIDPAKVGRDVGALLKLGKPLGVIVSADAEQTLADSDADVVVLATLSSFAELEEQLRLCINCKKNIITSCEELAYPWDEHPELAERIDAAAREAGVTILSNGVNPGFAMDALPIFLTQCLSTGRFNPGRKVSGCCAAASVFSAEDRCRALFAGV